MAAIEKFCKTRSPPITGGLLVYNDFCCEVYLLLSIYYSLLRYLKFTVLYHSSAFVKQLVDVHAAGEIGKINGCAFGQIGLLKHFAAENGIENLNGMTAFVSLLKIEINNGSGGIGIEPHKRGLSTRRRAKLILLCLERGG